MARQSEASLGDVCVLGLGKTGREVAGYLLDQPQGRVSSVTVYGGASSHEGDVTRELEEKGARVVLGTEDVTGRYDLTVASPGISEFSPFFKAAVACSGEVIGEPEFAWRESPRRWVGITGTNGKTTTTTLATQLLRTAGMRAVAVGNIGTLCTAELRDRPDDEWFVAELSSFQLATTRRLHPRVAVLLNVTPDHVEWHGSIEAYAAAKEKIFQNLTADDLAIVSDEDSWCRAVIRRLRERGLRVLTLNVHEVPSPDVTCAAFVRDGRLCVRLDGDEHVLLPVDSMPIKGEHNVQNALAASALAIELGVPDADVEKGILAFRALEHRIEPCGEVRGVRFVNDSKATNTDSVQKALTAFPKGRIVLLLGGHDKGTDLGPLAHDVVAKCKAAVCFGAAGERIASALEDELQGEGGALLVQRAPHLREAFEAAVADAEPGDVVLLSPACSSFDEFSNMAERGRAFKGYVAELGGTKGGM
jgi:UDP-N-acetylmuramoylalanine--D-glutamate ligase